MGIESVGTVDEAIFCLPRWLFWAAAAAIQGTLTDICTFDIPFVEVPETDTLPKADYFKCERLSDYERQPATLKMLLVVSQLYIGTVWNP